MIAEDNVLDKSPLSHSNESERSLICYFHPRKKTDVGFLLQPDVLVCQYHSGGAVFGSGRFSSDG